MMVGEVPDLGLICRNLSASLVKTDMMDLEEITYWGT